MSRFKQFAVKLAVKFNRVKCSISRSGRRQELFHPIAGQPVEIPFRQMTRANPLIDLLGLPIPIEAGPFHARAATVVRELNAMPQKRRTDPAPPIVGQDEDVFEVQRRGCAER